QHGPHLPLSVDAVLVDGVVAAALAHLPTELPALFLPTQMIGLSPEHARFPGTLTLKNETILRLWTDIAESVAAAGISKLVLFNGHGGNVSVMDLVARDLRARLDMLVYSVSWFNLPLTDERGQDVNALFSSEEHRFGIHGGDIEASMMLANERGPCPDAADQGVMERFSCKMAIAPTASISIICGGTSACIEPIPANIYTHKTLSGSFVVKNPYLEKLLQEKSKDSVKIWNSILEHAGSVQHLDFLSPDEKDSFKTSFEIDQRWLLELAADRAPYIDQAQSLNLFIPADVEKWDLLMLHFRAWELGIKSLYYLRSKSVQRAGFAGGVEADNTLDPKQVEL
ncbi:MAG: creatininase family protein, partial [Sphingomonadales bacterium]|nr:creatininase family protein [Sphingomonadales bacterium]